MSVSLSNPESKTDNKIFEQFAQTLQEDPGTGTAKVETPVTSTPPAATPPAAEMKVETVDPNKETKVEEPAKVETPVVKLPEGNTETKVSAEDQAYLDSLEPEAPATTNTAAKKDAETKTAKGEVDPEVKAKLSEYENTLNDPFVKAIAEYRKKGGQNINEFAKELGLVDPSTLTVKELYTKQAIAAGFKGDEIETAVDEQVNKFETLTKLEQKGIEKTLRDQATSEQAERLKTFATENKLAETQRSQSAVQAQTAMRKAAETANQKLDEGVDELIGKSWKGLPITQELGKAIRQTASELSRPLYDQQGNLIEYETQDAIEFAIWKVAGRQVLKANVELGRRLGFEKAIVERNRVSDNNNHAAVNPAKTDKESVDESISTFVNANEGRISLSNPKK